MNEVSRRDAMKQVAASIAAVIVGGAAVASEPQALGAGPCTRCACTGFGIGNGNICTKPGCRHSFSAHQRIHPPRLDEVSEVAAATYCVAYTYYKKRNGVVTKISSGKVGPYPTRQEAQSVVDDYNANDKTVKGTRYYYQARVTNCSPNG